MSQDSTLNGSPTKTSIADITGTLFNVISIFKARYPNKVSCRDLSTKTEIPIRKVQRLLKAYEQAGWIDGDGKTPQGFRLTIKARQLISASQSRVY